MTIRCPRCGMLQRRTEEPQPCTRCGYAADIQGAEDEPALVASEDESAEEEFSFDAGEEEPAAAAERDDAPDDEGDRRRPFGVMTPASFAVRGVLMVSLVYAVLSIYFYTHPEAVRQVFGGVPLLGPPLVENRVAPARIELVDVRGEYQRVKGDRVVFLITGTAVNNSSVAVRGIQIEGRIFGDEEQRQVVFCGAAPREVHELSLREIALLQTLEPPKDWRLAPGERTHFLIAFAGPPADLREFSAEVVAVRAPSRAARRSPLPEPATPPGGA